MRFLFVGDPHAEVHSLDDCRALTKYVLEVAQAQMGATVGATVVLAGDLYHNHAIINAEVQLFWWDFFETCKRKGIKTLVIKGNHDAPGTDGSRATALLAHYHQVATVLYEPFVYHDVLFCPYTSGAQLVKWSHEHPECNTLFCHQTFDGSTYENGFFAGDGVKPEDILQARVISGHIHAPQEFGKIWYPGAPRWRTLSDANTERAIWLIDTDHLGRVTRTEPFSTGTCCRRIVHLIDTPEDPVQITGNGKDDYRIDSKGPQAWLETRKPLFSGWAKWRPFKTDARVVAKVKESEGVGTAFKKWVDTYQPKHNTPVSTLNQLCKERLHAF